MSSEYTLTGRFARFVAAGSLVARATGWTVNPTLATTNEWGDSDSEGHTNRSPGRLDATFTAEGKYDTGGGGANIVYDLFERGDIVIATLFLNNAAPLLYYDFPRALCNDFSLAVNIDTEEVIGWTSAWGEDGRSYRPGEAGAPVRTIP